MSVIVILLLASLAVALAFLAAFVWAVRAGQFDDTATPALRVLADEPAAAHSAGAAVSVLGGPPNSLSLDGEGQGEGEPPRWKGTPPSQEAFSLTPTLSRWERVNAAAGTSAHDPRLHAASVPLSLEGEPFDSQPGAALLKPAASSPKISQNL